MKNALRFFGFCLLLAPLPSIAGKNTERLILFPRLHVGQVIRYQIGYRAATNTDTESTVAAPMAPVGGQTNANIILEVEVEDLRNDAGGPVARLRTRIVNPDAISTNNTPRANSTPQPNRAPSAVQPNKTVDFTLHADGRVTDVQGLDTLSSDERAAWQEWISRFGGAAALPQRGVKLGEKWKSDEPISNSLLSGLSWEKKSEYVNDAPCAAMQLTPQGDPAETQQPPETCAVILTTAILKQKSSPKDATPEDYKLHDLRNMGTAKGQNQIISYFSLTTGLVVSATEDANQSMNLTVATENGSNRVHYSIDAESHARVLLLADSPASPR
ncbi:MAG: hypothetical protein ACRD51_17160 [Candidatus Acidiferrum sp.]